MIKLGCSHRQEMPNYYVMDFPLSKLTVRANILVARINLRYEKVIYIMNLPTHLYHYTSIESLTLIFKNRTIRFAALNTVDDPTEGITSDMNSIGQWFLVSCWTDDEEESIPL